LNRIQESIRLLEEHYQIINSISDFRNIEESLDKVTKKIEDYESEVESRDGRVAEAVRINTSHRMEVDSKRIHRCENESSNLNLAYLRESYNFLLNENNRMKNENITLERDAREAKNDLQAIIEKKFLREKQERAKRESTKNFSVLN